MRRSLVVIGLGVVLLLPACGGSPEDKAKRAALGFLEGVEERDADEVCPLMADSLKVELLGPLGETVSETPAQCKEKIGPLLGRFPVIRDAKATRVDVVRANATVAVSGRDAQGRTVRDTLKLRKDVKDWKVTDTRVGPG